MFLVTNYIKAYSSEQVLIPSLYDGEFKKNDACEVDTVLGPPVDKNPKTWPHEKKETCFKRRSGRTSKKPYGTRRRSVGWSVGFIGLAAF